jgi:hypothetical protein
LLKGTSVEGKLAGEYAGATPQEKTLSTFTAVASGDFKLRVKVKKGTTYTTLIESVPVSLASGKTVTVCLTGLPSRQGVSNPKEELTIVQH